MSGLDTLVQAFAEDPKVAAAPQEKPPWKVMTDAVGYGTGLLDIADTDLRSMPPSEREPVKAMLWLISQMAHELVAGGEEAARATST